MKFHPSQPDSLATGSTDGLVCVFDISQTSEDDAILWTFNTESSVVSSYFVWTILGFFSANFTTTALQIMRLSLKESLGYYAWKM